MGNKHGRDGRGTRGASRGVDARGHVRDNPIMRIPLFAFALLATGWSLHASARTPHVVVFIADDFTWSDCGAYGARDVRTPRLDRLAKEGMRFERAFAASATCTPS